MLTFAWKICTCTLLLLCNFLPFKTALILLISKEPIKAIKTLINVNGEHLALCETTSSDCLLLALPGRRTLKKKQKKKHSYGSFSHNFKHTVLPQQNSLRYFLLKFAWRPCKIHEVVDLALALWWHAIWRLCHEMQHHAALSAQSDQYESQAVTFNVLTKNWNLICQNNIQWVKVGNSHWGQT